MSESFHADSRLKRNKINKRPLGGKGLSGVYLSTASTFGLSISRDREPRAQGPLAGSCSWIGGQPLHTQDGDGEPRWGGADHRPFSSSFLLLLLTCLACGGVAAVPSHQEDSFGSFLLVSIHAMGLESQVQFETCTRNEKRKEPNFLR